ncbi:MAG: tetratricopeptide repeat protein [Peptostreptococcaceae bacterium]|jgi:tetratricopeptide (TPR) repeat protein|nr:tetratricopeptide repeat protein [Peptostreptococcaceae bacterium]
MLLKKNKTLLVLLFIASLFLISCSNQEISNEDTKIEKQELKEDEKKLEELKLKEDEAKALVANQKYEEAIMKYSEIIIEQPTNGYLNMSVGNIYLKQNKYDEAINEYNKALEKDSKIEGAYNNIAGIYMLKKDYDKTLELLNKGLAVLSESKELRFKKAQILFVKEEYKEAIKEFEYFGEYKEYTNYMETKRFLGILYLKEGNKEKAIENLQYYIDNTQDEKFKENIKNLLKEIK